MRSSSVWWATGINDAGIYAGQCENVIIRESEAYGNVIGIEVENTNGFEIYNNRAYDNALGIFVDLLPQLEAKVSLRGKVYDNVSENNNGENFAPPGELAAQVPSGLGLFILAADQNEVYNNVIRGNKTAGIALFNLRIAFEEDEIDVGPNPEDNWIHDNQLENNGFDPDPSVRELGIPGADILWDGSGANNRFDQPGAKSFPPVLPSSRWPTPFYRLYWNVLNTLIGLLS
ncbi:MAG: right-handed parallel beta-helix repeat-containing protein [Ardenticatenia bacterium]|nr:right-handed parallel beta-helix repeat-containing protein [Ardenticatenia bacterium]